ncbi:MAG: hypothetical protein GSR79_02810 [Desulfurococcales archaeon]|nr:hypothetical protein [Desulfurococcales archaeon]
MDSEIEAVNPTYIDFLIAAVGDFNIILETRYDEGCFIPVKLFLINCSEYTKVTDDILFIISKADELQYHKGCVYLIFNVKYVNEVKRILELVSDKLGISSGQLINLKDHAFVEVDEL